MRCRGNVSFNVSRFRFCFRRPGTSENGINVTTRFFMFERKTWLVGGCGVATGVPALQDGGGIVGDNFSILCRKWNVGWRSQELHATAH